MTPDENTPFSAEPTKQRLREAMHFVEQVTNIAQDLDAHGAEEDHPEGSEERALARLRDELDFAVCQLIRNVRLSARMRAETTRCSDLLVEMAINELGDGDEALHLMRRYHELRGDETDADGTTPPETMPDFFAWDTYLRVSALPDLVKQYPGHLQHSARNMHGWPMVVSHHLDCLPGFRETAHKLHLGEDYPLDVGPRKKRGRGTPLLCYLEPLVWRLHVLHVFLKDTQKVRGNESFVGRICGIWWMDAQSRPGPSEQAILELLPSLPPLSQKSSAEWSLKVIVPLIMLGEVGTSRETCHIPSLRNIWAHHAVKSPATFRSRLLSQVNDTLKRFGRAG